VQLSKHSSDCRACRATFFRPIPGTRMPIFAKAVVRLSRAATFRASPASAVCTASAIRGCRCAALGQALAAHIERRGYVEHAVGRSASGDVASCRSMHAPRPTFLRGSVVHRRAASGIARPPTYHAHIYLGRKSSTAAAIALSSATSASHRAARHPRVAVHTALAGLARKVEQREIVEQLLLRIVAYGFPGSAGKKCSACAAIPNCASTIALA